MKRVINIILFVIINHFSCAQEKCEVKNTWNFAVVGDTHITQSDVLKKIVPDLIKNRVEVVLFVGDIIQAGKGQNARGMLTELEQWQEITEPLRKAGIKILAVRGNHEADVKGNSIASWVQYFGSDLNISYTHRNVTFIGLDNYIKGEHTADLKWLEKELSSAKTELIIPFGHEPLFTSHTFHPVCLDANIGIRDSIWNLFSEADIKYYFCGHAHQYNVSTITGKDSTLKQAVSGGGGGRLQPKRHHEKNEKDHNIVLEEFISENGYVLVAVDNQKISIKWRKI